MTAIPTVWCNGFAACGTAPLEPLLFIMLLGTLTLWLVNRMTPEVDR